MDEERDRVTGGRGEWWKVKGEVVGTLSRTL